METRDIGPFYWHTLEYPERDDSTPPRIERAVNEETEEPYRRGPGIVLRYGRLKAIVVGVWRRTRRDDQEGLLSALRGQRLEVGADDIREWRDGRGAAEVLAREDARSS